MFGRLSRKKPRLDAITAFLGAGTAYHGQFNFQGVVRIDGEIFGDIVSDGVLVLGEQGLVEGSIQVGELVTSGRIIGDVAASRRLVLNKSARVRGNLVAPSVVVEAGAVINGRCCMTGPEAVAMAADEVPCALAATTDAVTETP
ncbi:MAG: polymer-forming cytoskeletal protein [Acidobacteriota bacterium]